MWDYGQDDVPLRHILPECCWDCEVKASRVGASWLKVNHNGREMSFALNFNYRILGERVEQEVQDWLMMEHQK